MQVQQNSPSSIFSLLTASVLALHRQADKSTGEDRAHLQQLQQGLSALAVTFSGQRTVLAPLGDGWWYVGSELQPQRRRFKGLALDAAHAAFSGKTPLCSEFTPVASADAVVREALRNAANSIGAWDGCRDLASAFHQLTVCGKPARVEYRRRAGSAILVLSSPAFTSDAMPATIEANLKGPAHVSNPSH